MKQNWVEEALEAIGSWGVYIIATEYTPENRAGEETKKIENNAIVLTKWLEFASWRITENTLLVIIPLPQSP